MFLFLYSEATRKEAAHDVISFYLLYIKNNSLFLYTYVDLCSHIFLVVKKTVLGSGPAQQTNTCIDTHGPLPRSL